MSEVIYRFIKKEEIKDLIELSYAIYNKSTSFEYFKWFYDYFEPINNSIVVAEADSKLVALQPFTLLSLNTPDGERKVAFLTGVGTHPDYRRRGIFSNLIDYTSNVLYENENIQFAYTFPNEFSFPGFMKLEGWQLLGELNLYLKPLKYYSTIAGLLKSFKKGLTISEKSEASNEFLHWNNILSSGQEESGFFVVEEFNNEFDYFWNSVKSNFDVCIKRDSQYLNWRYIENPYKERYLILGFKVDKEVRGYIVLKKEILFNCKTGLIVDILSTDEKIANLLIKEALKILRSENLDISGFVGLPRKVIHFALRKNGYFIVPHQLIPKHFRIIYKPLQFTNCFSLNNWYLTWGDTDLL